MKRRAPAKATATADASAKLNHLSKMNAKVKRAVAADISSKKGAPVAQIDGRESFSKVYRPRGGGYGCGSELEPGKTTGTMSPKKKYS